MKTKVLLINPNKWGRGITHIWIASHSAYLKSNDIDVRLFDATFYENWTNNETLYNTFNTQYKPSKYEDQIKFNKNNIYSDLQEVCKNFKPDYIFWSALSSHIHGEGEYVNIQYGYELLDKINTNGIKIAGGLQATSSPELVLKNLKNIDFLISGESEIVLYELIKTLNSIKNSKSEVDVDGVSYINKQNKFVRGKTQKMISDMDIIPHYDYSIFDEQVLLRPYNGKVLRAIDYELSRGCMFSCQYCVETIIQNYYGFNEVNKRGSILNSKGYLRNKSAPRIFEELKYCIKELKIDLIRSQDTNFLTIDKTVLKDLAEMVQNEGLIYEMYIETRPEGINEKSIKLLKDLNVGGVGMGVEISDQSFREDKLRRFADYDKIIKAFDLLKEYGIKSTAYNIIGLPDQDEESILETISFNKRLNPDNVTVAYYSPYLGTERQVRGNEIGDFKDYEFDVDSTFRSKTQNIDLSKEKLSYYKENFVKLVRSQDNNLKKLEKI